MRARYAGIESRCFADRTRRPENTLKPDQIGTVTASKPPRILFAWLRTGIVRHFENFISSREAGRAVEASRLRPLAVNTFREEGRS